MYSILYYTCTTRVFVHELYLPTSIYTHVNNNFVVNVYTTGVYTHTCTLVFQLDMTS